MRKKFKYLGMSCMFAIAIIFVIGFIQTFFFKNEYPFIYKPVLILSGSMEPSFSPDDLAIVKKADKLTVGDIVLYTDSNGKKIMHRIKSISGDMLITRGDANNTDDEPISSASVVGVYVGRIKYVGKIIKFIKTPIGLIAIIGVILLIYFMPNKKDEELEKENKIAKIAIEGTVYVLLLTACILAGYYSRYVSQAAGDDTGTVAKWDNDLMITTGEEMVFKNNEENSLTIPIQVSSASDVASKYSILIENLAKEYHVRLYDDTNSFGYSISGDIIQMHLNGDEIIFDMNQMSKEIGNYRIDKTIDGDKTNFFVTDISKNKEILVLTFVLTEDSNGNINKSINVSYHEIGEFLIGGPMAHAFSLEITTALENLPSNANVNISALFEQID